MRLYKVVILVNAAFGIGLLSGYLWWERDVERLRRELTAVTQRAKVRQAGDRVWGVRGIVRGVSRAKNQIMITHEEILGLMGPMTMSFPLEDPKLSRGLAPGDRIQFTLKETKLRVVTAIRKEGSQ